MPPTPAAPGGCASGPPCALHLRARPAPLRAHLAPRLRLCCSWCGRASPAPEPGPRSCRLPGAGAGRAPGPPRAPPPAPRHLGAPPPAPQPAPTRERRPSLRRGPQALTPGKLRQADGATWGALLAGEGPRALPSPPGLPPPARRCLRDASSPGCSSFRPLVHSPGRPPLFLALVHSSIHMSVRPPPTQPSSHPTIHLSPPIHPFLPRAPFSNALLLCLTSASPVPAFPLPWGPRRITSRSEDSSASGRGRARAWGLAQRGAGHAAPAKAFGAHGDTCSGHGCVRGRATESQRARAWCQAAGAFLALAAGLAQFSTQETPF